MNTTRRLSRLYYDRPRLYYDRPRLIHQSHLCMILEASQLKDGSGKELRRLHDMIQQHLQALRAMDHEPSGPFITSAIELKLDTNTLFEWQKFSLIMCHIIRRFWSFLTLELKCLRDLPCLRKCRAWKTVLRI